MIYKCKNCGEINTETSINWVTKQVFNFSIRRIEENTKKHYVFVCPSCNGTFSGDDFLVVKNNSIKKI